MCYRRKAPLYLKGIYGTLSDDETHYKHRVRFDKFSAANNTARVELQNIHNLLITELTSVSLGGVHQLNKSKIDWDLSYYNNLFKYGNIPDKQNNSYYVIKYTQSGVGINPDYISDKGNGPRAYWKADGGKLDLKDPDALFSFYSNPNFKMDASQMRFTDLEFYKVYVQEKDKIVAGLCSSFVVSSGVVKSAGKFLMDSFGISEFWMPFATGLIFIIPLIIFAVLLNKIPAPNDEDIALKKERKPLSEEERKPLVKKFFLPLVSITILYICLTILRDFRDNFSREIWDEMNGSAESSVFTLTEIPISIMVLLILGFMVKVKNNRKALPTTIISFLAELFWSLYPPFYFKATSFLRFYG